MLQRFLEQVFYLSVQDKKDIYEKILKLTEEVGEISEAFLSYSDAHGCSYKNKTKLDIIEEIGDLVAASMSLLALLYDNNISDKELEGIEECWMRKLKKWENRIDADGSKALAMVTLHDTGTHNHYGELTKEYGGKADDIPWCDFKEHMRCFFDIKSCSDCPISK
jgi:NTP pyrophosphatase (non-canonical NTP hydrolase)